MPQGIEVEDNLPSSDLVAPKFIEGELKYAEGVLGPSRFPVHLIKLEYAQGQPHTKIDDENGAYTITLSRQPEEFAYQGQLGHEVGHLLNPYLYDPYVEGLNTVIAEHYLKSGQMDWSPWQQYLANSDTTEQRFYGSTYRMMTEVWAAAGPEYIRTILSFGVPTRHRKDVLHIEINDWLKTMPPDKRKLVTSKIKMFQAEVLSSMPHTGYYEFAVPFENSENKASADAAAAK